MFYREHLSRKIFLIFNSLFLILAAIICILPMVHILAVSFSSEFPVNSGLVRLWPIDFTISSYKYVLNDMKFFLAFFISVKRTFLGLVVNMPLTILAAYPLSKSKKTFRAHSFYAWFFLITILWYQSN